MTVSLAFPQIPLGFHGIWSQWICGDSPSGFGDRGCISPLHFACNHDWYNQLLFLCCPCFSAFYPDDWALPLAWWGSQLFKAALFMEVPTASPLPLLLQGALAVRGSFTVVSNLPSRLPCFWPWEALIHKSLTQMCLCAFYLLSFRCSAYCYLKEWHQKSRGARDLSPWNSNKLNT